MVAFLLAGLFFRPALVNAHHEAIFGPQSSLVLSADKFVSFQVFSRELGPSDASTNETTTLVSSGVRVSKARPLTFTAVVPYSWISHPGEARRSGVEDIVLGLRYRHDLKGLQEKWGREGNFLMGMGAFELNNGTIDHRAWSGPLDSMGAILGSLERGKWSAIGYAVTRFNVADAENNNARDRLEGQSDSNTGGEEVLLHPTLVYSPGHNFLFFGMMSVPVWRDFEDPTAQDEYRFGTGVVYAW